MPKVITGSSNIAVLDSRVIVDLCIGKFYIDLTPSTYIGDGADNVLGAKVKITNPYGVVIKDYAAPYEIAPSLTEGMDTVVQFNVPLQSLNYQYGKYVIDVKLIDSDSKEHVITKTIDVKCIPNTKNKKYGTISAELKGSCKDGKVRVFVNTPPYTTVLFLKVRWLRTAWSILQEANYQQQQQRLAISVQNYLKGFIRSQAKLALHII